MADPYILILTGAGILIAMVVWLPMVLRRLPLSLPIICIALGVGIFSLPMVTLRPLPLEHPKLTEHLAEIVVLIALMGAGLKIDRRFHWARWSVTWRLLAIAMPLTILGITALGIWGLGLPLAAALLLGASLAPTDPVLASDVQVGPPRSGHEDEVRFGLTSEAGLNDGLAFPFVHLAILLAAAGSEVAFGRWIAVDVGWKVAVGAGAGWLLGRLFGWLTFHVSHQHALARSGDGMIAIAATFVSYGVTQMLGGYGFLAVFVAALTFRHAHRHHEFHLAMHVLTEQVERLAMMAVLLLFGGALVHGLLAPLRGWDVAVALLVLLVVRPLAGLVALLGLRASTSEKLVLAFFGIRGIGSIYYLAFGGNHMELAEAERLWAIIGLIVLLSVLIHGLSVTPIMRALDRGHGRDPDAAEGGPPPEAAPQRIGEPPVTPRRVPEM